MTDWNDARRAAHAAASPLPVDHLPLAEAGGRALAEPLRADVPLPAFDSAAMDGYAVRGGGPWRVTGQILAGHHVRVDLRAGEAVEIATGAPVPAGTDGILPYERAGRDGAEVSGQVDAGQYVRRAGESAPAGAELAPAGTPVTPVLLGLAASVGYDTLPVRCRPRVAALLTGDELIHRGTPGGGQVRDAVGPMLPGLVGAAGGDLALTMPVPDSPPAELPGALAGAEGDVVVVCGASSSGPADRLRAVLHAAGAQVLVDGVACRPGRPQALARMPDGRLVVGAPGNPNAALVAVLTLLGPVLAGLAGRALPDLPLVPLHGDPRPVPGLTRLVAVRWAGAAVHPVGSDRGGSLWPAASADGLAAVPPGWAGAPVPLLALPGRF